MDELRKWLKATASQGVTQITLRQMARYGAAEVLRTWKLEGNLDALAEEIQREANRFYRDDRTPWGSLFLKGDLPAHGALYRSEVHTLTPTKP